MRRRISPIFIISSLFFMMILVYIGCLISYGVVDWTTPKIENTKLKTNMTDKEKIAKELMVKYLSQYKSILVPYRDRLKDFCIEKIDNVTDDNGSFNFTVCYSVKPYAIHQSNWIAGNGVTGDNGWIKNKLEFVHGKKDKNIYFLEGAGTGP